MKKLVMDWVGNRIDSISFEKHYKGVVNIEWIFILILSAWLSLIFLKILQ